MPDTINNPVSEVFSRWSKDIQPAVGKGNFSMEKSQTIASGKTKYARLFPRSRQVLKVTNVQQFFRFKRKVTHLGQRLYRLHMKSTAKVIRP